MRIRRNRDNKIKIPWYGRRVPIRRADQVDYTPADFGFRFRIPRVPRPQPVMVEEPVTQPATEPVTQPATEPVTETGRVPVRVPAPIPEPSPVPEPFPGLPGLPGLPEAPWRRFPVPEGEAPSPPFRQPDPVPVFPLGIPSIINDPEFDWEAHFRRIAEEYEQTVQGRPEPVSDNPLVKTFEMIMKPVIYLTIGAMIVDQYVEAKITDPIYAKMLETPVLGDALREAEQAEMDVEALANYFATYDWDNMDINEMLKDLTLIVGAAGAARIVVFFVGRKVVFRI